MPDCFIPLQIHKLTPAHIYTYIYICVCVYNLSKECIHLYGECK